MNRKKQVKHRNTKALRRQVKRKSPSNTHECEARGNWDIRERMAQDR